MIGVHVQPNGTVTLSTRRPNLMAAMDKARYLVRSKPGLWMTWWPYLQDLRRDFAHRLAFTRPSAPALRGLLDRINTREAGSLSDLKAVFAIDPYPYQARGINAIINTERLLLGDDVGLGKEQPIDTPTMTPQGWRPMGEIQVGDEVIGSDGRPTRVEGVFPQGIKPSFRVRLSDGASVEAGADHLWTCEYWKAGRARTQITLTTEQLRTRPKVGRLDLARARLFLPMLSAPVSFVCPTEPLPIPPYVMGALIANGCLGHGTPALVYGVRDWADVVDKLAGADLGNSRTYESAVHTTVRGVTTIIRDLGLDVGSAHKRIPQVYMRAGIGQRIELLHGLMDADGSITKTGNRVTYHTISPRLAANVRALVEALGGIATVRRYDRDHEDKPVEFQVRIRLPEGIAPFSIPRKLSRYNPGPHAHPSRQIVGVEFVRDVEQVCIKVAAKDRLYLTRHCILTHNTIQTLGAMLVLFRRGLIERAVIVTPASLKVQWYEELFKFGRPEAIPEGAVVVRSGMGAAERRRIYGGAWRILIVNPEILMRDYKALQAITHRVGFCALDEASCIRNSETKTAKVMKLLFGKTRFKIALTATPVENNLIDLYSVFEWLDRRIFISRKYFESRYIVWIEKRFRVTNREGRRVMIRKRIPVQYRRLHEVRAKIRPMFLRRRVVDVGLELPELVVKWEVVELGPQQRKIYDACREETLGQIAGLRGAALRGPLQALRQACNSTALVKEGERPYQVKVDRIRELLMGELAGEKVIIFTDYERFVRILAQALRDLKPATFTGGNKAGGERDDQMNAFKVGDRRILIMTKAGERGHNLQMAGVVINADLPFNPAVLKQRIGRARRLKSQHDVVRVINMIAADTIEETLILKRIYSRRRLFEGVLGEDELTDADPIERMEGRSLSALL